MRHINIALTPTKMGIGYRHLLRSLEIASTPFINLFFLFANSCDNINEQDLAAKKQN